jgi:hypothetical protein
VNRLQFHRSLLIICILSNICVAGVTGATATVSELDEPDRLLATTDSAGVHTAESSYAGAEPRQENPDSVLESGNTTRPASQLLDPVVDRLIRSTEQIESGNYDEAQQLLGDEYDEKVSSYMELYRVAQPDNTQVQEREILLSETSAKQVEYAGIISEYKQTQSEYQFAKLENDHEREQRLARDLKRLSRELQQREQIIVGNYNQISDELQSSAINIRQKTGEIEAQTRDTVGQELPSLRVEDSPETALAGTIIRSSGQVEIADEPASSVSIRMYLEGELLVQTRSNDDGAYVIRGPVPADVPVGSNNLSVVAGEGDTGLIAVSEQNALTVREAEPALTLRAVREEATSAQEETTEQEVGAAEQAGQNVTIFGELLATPEAGIAGQNVSIIIEDEQQETVRTGPSGNYGATIELNESVADTDSVTITAIFDGEGTSVNSAEVSANLNLQRERSIPVDTLISIFTVFIGIAAGIGGSYGIYRYRQDTSGTEFNPESIDPGTIDPGVAPLDSCAGGRPRGRELRGRPRVAPLDSSDVNQDNENSSDPIWDEKEDS